QVVEVVGVGVDGDVAAAEVGEGEVLPVVAVRVRQDDGVHLVPRRPDGGESGREHPRVEPAVDEEPEPIDLQQRGVTAAAAGKDCKPRRHVAVFLWAAGAGYACADDEALPVVTGSAKAGKGGSGGVSPRLAGPPASRGLTTSVVTVPAGR